MSKLKIFSKHGREEQIPQKSKAADGTRVVKHNYIFIAWCKDNYKFILFLFAISCYNT